MTILLTIAFTVGLFASVALAALGLLQLPAFNGNDAPRETGGNRRRARQAMADFDREWAHWNALGRDL